ncbi:MAG: ABC transporter permease subunit [Spirochaetota bacterium]
MRRIKRSSVLLMMVPLAGVMAIAAVIPAFDALRSSLLQGDTWVGLDNFRRITGDRAFLYSLNVTALWMSVTISVTTVVSILLARRLRRQKGRSVLYSMLFIPLGIPIYIAVPVWRAFLHGDGGNSLFSSLTGVEVNLLTDPAAAFLGAAAVSIWMSIPITVFVIYSQLKQVSQEQIDIARLESSRSATIFSCVEFPVIRSSVMIMIALNGIKAMKEFTLIHLMTDGGVPLVSGITERYMVGSTTTLSVFLYDLFRGLNSYGITAAFAVLMGLLVAVAMGFWFFSRMHQGYLLRAFLAIVFALYVLLRRDSIVEAAIAVVLVVVVRRERVFRWVLFGSLGFTGVRLLQRGFLEGFSPLVPLILFVLVLTGRREYHEAPLYKEWFVKAGTPVATWLLTASSIMIVYYLLWLSFSGVRSCYVGSILPPYATFDAYKELFVDEGFIRYLANSALLGFSTALAVPLIALPAAWAAAGMRKRRSDALVSAVQVLNVSSGMHSLIPLFAVFAALSLTNTHSALVLVYCAHALPFSLLIMRNHVEKRSRVLQEAAMLDGASTAAYLRHIFLPVSFPMIKTTMIFAWLGAWNGFIAPLILLSDEAKYPISLKLYTYVGSIGSGAPQWHLFAAASVVNLLIIRAIGGRQLGLKQLDQPPPRKNMI